MGERDDDPRVTAAGDVFRSLYPEERTSEEPEFALPEEVADPLLTTDRLVAAGEYPFRGRETDCVLAEERVVLLAVTAEEDLAVVAEERVVLLAVTGEEDLAVGDPLILVALREFPLSTLVDERRVSALGEATEATVR